MVYVWLAVVCVSALVEAFTLQMAGIWFVVGGLVALIMAACDVALEWQIIAFIVISLILLLALRRLCLKFLLKKDTTRTNIDVLIGSEVKLLNPLNVDTPGAVKFGDVIWTAVAKSSSVNLPEGALVRVLEVSGNKLIVEPVEREIKDEESEVQNESIETQETTGDTLNTAKNQQEKPKKQGRKKSEKKSQ